MRRRWPRSACDWTAFRWPWSSRLRGSRSCRPNRSPAASRIGSLRTGGAADGPERHRTLRAALDWSFLLLDAHRASLAAAICQSSPGGAVLEPVESVCADASLPVATSWRARATGRPLAARRARRVRRGPLPTARTVRQYALERLREANEESAGTPAAPELVRRTVRSVPSPNCSGRTAGVAESASNAEHDNVRLALGWSIATRRQSSAAPGRPDCGSSGRCAATASEGQRWLETALALGSAGRRRRARRAQHGAASLAWLRGDYTARQHSTRPI